MSTEETSLTPEEESEVEKHATEVRKEAREEVSSWHESARAFHELGIHVPSRTIYMGSEIVDWEGETGVDAEMAKAVVKNIYLLERDCSEPITIIMNNVGGDEYHGAAIYDAIKQSPCKTTIIVRGHAMSMGSIILQAAHDRVMGPNSTQMIHYGTWGCHQHSKTAQKWAKEGLRWDEWMEQLYMDRIHERCPLYSLDALKALLDHDTFLTAQQSIDLGLADRIG